jgi:hypothetical protein
MRAFYPEAVPKVGSSAHRSKLNQRLAIEIQRVVIERFRCNRFDRTNSWGDADLFIIVISNGVRNI